MLGIGTYGDQHRTTYSHSGARSNPDSRTHGHTGTH